MPVIASRSHPCEPSRYTALPSLAWSRHVSVIGSQTARSSRPVGVSYQASWTRTTGGGLGVRRWGRARGATIVSKQAPRSPVQSAYRTQQDRKTGSASVDRSPSFARFLPSSRWHPLGRLRRLGVVPLRLIVDACLRVECLVQVVCRVIPIPARYFIPEPAVRRRARLLAGHCSTARNVCRPRMYRALQGLRCGPRRRGVGSDSGSSTIGHGSRPCATQRYTVRRVTPRMAAAWTALRDSTADGTSDTRR